MCRHSSDASPRRWASALHEPAVMADEKSSKSEDGKGIPPAGEQKTAETRTWDRRALPRRLPGSREDATVGVNAVDKDAIVGSTTSEVGRRQTDVARAQMIAAQADIIRAYVLTRRDQGPHRQSSEHGQGGRRRSRFQRRRAFRHPLGQFQHHRQPGPVRSAAVRHRAPRAEDRVGLDARVRRRLAEGDGRRSDRGRESGARQPEPPAADQGAAGLHPRRRGAAADGELRPGRARRDGAEERRGLRQDRRARLRLHPEDLPDDLQRQLRGPVRLLPVRGSGPHPDLPHARRQGIGLGRHHRRQGSQPDRSRAHQRGRGEQGGQEPEAARARARALHRHPRVASGGALPVADDRHLQRARRSRPGRAAT